MQNKKLPVIFGVVLLAVLVFSLIYSQVIRPRLNSGENAEVVSTPVGQTSPTPAPSASPVAQGSETPAPASSASPGLPVAQTALDLTVDANGLSKSTVLIETTYGPIRFKFYPKDAPNTVLRIAELIKSGFYNGLVFHRVVPGFVVQGGDPSGDGSGGSGTKLKAEFNNRLHVEGAVAMARLPSDFDTADSQFYIALGTLPHLDHQYTVFGQVISGMDAVRKIKKDDKMVKVSIE